MDQWGEVDTVVVGESGFLEGAVTEENGIDMRDLTGCAVALSFWKPDATAPHVTRAARVLSPATDGRFLYRLRGDEYATEDRLLKIQVTIHRPEFDSASTGRGGIRYVGPDLTRKVLPTP